MWDFCDGGMHDACSEGGVRDVCDDASDDVNGGVYGVSDGAIGGGVVCDADAGMCDGGVCGVGKDVCDVCDDVCDVCDVCGGGCEPTEGARSDLVRSLLRSIN